MSESKQQPEHEQSEPSTSPAEPKNEQAKPQASKYVFKIVSANPKNAFDFEDVADK